MDGFQKDFREAVCQLRVGGALSPQELELLYQAAFYASLCNIVLNGLGNPDGEIKPELEPARIRMEMTFMEARDALWQSSGWQGLAPAERNRIARHFLVVIVCEENLVH